MNDWNFHTFLPFIFLLVEGVAEASASSQVSWVYVARFLQLTL
jgi:hypothetical protein